MKQKAELSQNSYLLKSLKSMSVYKLMANTFNGFVYIEFDQTLDILQSKKLLLFIQIPTELHCCLQIFILFWMITRIRTKPAWHGHPCTKVLPDIVKKITELPQKPPVFGNILSYKYYLVMTRPRRARVSFDVH